MKKLYTFLIFLLPGAIYAQAPNIEWQHTYGGSGTEEASVIRPTSDGGYIITGLSTSSDGDVTGHHGANDHWVVKIDSAGVMEWNHSYGGTSDDKGYDIRQVPSGGYILTGYESSTDGDVTGNHGSTDYWVVKLDDTGGIEWQKALGGSSAENSYSVIPTFDGGYAVMGLSNTTNGTGDVTGNHGTFDFWLCKLDGAGTLLWQKSLGSSSTEQGFGLQQTTDSGYILCGYSSGSNGDVTVNQGGSDYWIVKTDDTGGIEWQKSYGGSASDRAFSVLQTKEGGYIVSGVSLSADGDVIGNHGGNDYWVLKLDDTGGMEWQRTLGGSGDDFGRSVFQTLDGGYIIGGRSNTPNDGDVTGNHGDYDYWLVKLDSAGATEWQKCLGGTLGEGAPGATVPFMTVSQLPDGKYIMAGATFSTDGDATGNVSASATDDNYWVLKLFGCPAYSQLTDTTCYNTAFDFNGTLLTGAGTYYDTLATSGNCDSILVLNLAVRAAINPVVTYTGGILSTDTYLAYQWILDGQDISGADAQTYTPTANGAYQVAVISEHGCLDTSTTMMITDVSTGQLSQADAVRIYPNPAKDRLTVSCASCNGPVTVSLYGVEGKLILSQPLSAAIQYLPLQNLSKGVYLLKILAADGTSVVRRIIKE